MTEDEKSKLLKGQKEPVKWLNLKGEERELKRVPAKFNIDSELASQVVNNTKRVIDKALKQKTVCGDCDRAPQVFPLVVVNADNSYYVVELDSARLTYIYEEGAEEEFTTEVVFSTHPCSGNVLFEHEGANLKKAVRKRRNKGWGKVF